MSKTTAMTTTSELPKSNCSFTWCKCDNPVLSDRDFEKEIKHYPPTAAYLRAMGNKLCLEHLKDFMDKLAPLEFDYFNGYQNFCTSTQQTKK
jgi:hypothetical protein